MSELLRTHKQIVAICKDILLAIDGKKDMDGNLYCALEVSIQESEEALKAQETKC